MQIEATPKHCVIVGLVVLTVWGLFGPYLHSHRDEIASANQQRAMAAELATKQRMEREGAANLSKYAEECRANPAWCAKRDEQMAIDFLRQSESRDKMMKSLGFDVH